MEAIQELQAHYLTTSRPAYEHFFSIAKTVRRDFWPHDYCVR
jgi:hypothetical protein